MERIAHIDLLDAPWQCKLLGQVGIVKITQLTVLGMNDFRELLCSMVFMSPFDGNRSISYIFLSNKKYCHNVWFYFSEFIARIKSIKIRWRQKILQSGLVKRLLRTAKYFLFFCHFISFYQQSYILNNLMYICIKSFFF